MAATAALVLHFAVRLPWGVAALASFVGWPILGVLITVDDDLPGGWSNLDGKQRADWRRACFWGNLFAGLAVSAVAAGIDGDWVRGRVLLYAGGALVCATVSGLLCRRRPPPERADESSRPDAGTS
jgi:hypothetical protein